MKAADEKKQTPALPQPSAFRAEYAALVQEKDRLYLEYGKLKREVKRLDTLKANVDKILNISGRGEESILTHSRDVKL